MHPVLEEVIFLDILATLGITQSQHMSYQGVHIFTDIVLQLNLMESMSEMLCSVFIFVCSGAFFLTTLII